MKNFFTPVASDYMTPLPKDSASPYPQEYDEASEKEMQFLQKSSLNARGNPEYEDVMKQTELHCPWVISSLLKPLTWIFNHRPLCWIRSFCVDLLVMTRIHVVLKPIVSNEEVLKNPHIAKEIERLVNDPEHPQPRASVLAHARDIVNRMACRQTDWVLRVFYLILSFVFRTMMRKVHVDKHGLGVFHKQLETLEDGVGVVYLPTHKSHIDYLVLSYISALYGLPIPVIAAGDNLNIPVVGALFRYSGAFFMRRSLGDDTLYRAVLEGYLEEVLKSGSTLEFFIEGGRSRDGTILPPKYGLLNVILEAVKMGRLKDVLLVPIAVDYEHCPELNSYVKYMMGGKKHKESLSALLKNAASILSMDCGDAFVTLGTPMLLQELLRKMEKEDSTLDVRHEVKYVGAHVCQAMRANSVVTVSTLVATAFLEFPAGEWVSEAEMSVRIDTIRSWLRKARAMEGYSAWSVGMLHQFVRNFPHLVDIEGHNYRAKQGIPEQITFFYYRNCLLHHFLADATVLYVIKSLQIQAGRSELSLVDVVPVVDLMCRIIGAHIPYNQVTSAPAMESLIARNILVLRDDLVSYPASEESYVHFCVSLVAPLVDSLTIVTEAIQNLVPGSAAEEVDLTVLLLKCMEMTRSAVESKKIAFPFTVNTQMVRNNVEGLVAAGVLSKRKEKANYFISLTPSYQDKAKVDALNESMVGLRIDMKSLPMIQNEDVDVTNDMIDLMVDVKKRKK